MNLEISMWNIEDMTGYQPKTTFWMDFSIADKFGIDAVKDTYKWAFESWKSDVVYLTELAMVLNWKIWEHYEKNEALTEVYQDLWTKADVYAMENLTGNDLDYYLRTTD